MKKGNKHQGFLQEVSQDHVPLSNVDMMNYEKIRKTTQFVQPELDLQDRSLDKGNHLKAIFKEFFDTELQIGMEPSGTRFRACVSECS